MSRRYRVARSVGFLLAAAVLAATLGAVYVRREPGLLDHATRLADVSSWWQPEDLISGVEPYQWLSCSRIFSHSGWWRLRDPFLYDLGTHRKTPLPRLGQLVSRGDYGTTAWRLSPDGQWVLWTTQFLDGVRTARLDGSEYRVWPLKSASGIAWLEDGHHWAALDGRQGVPRPTRAVIGDVRDPRDFHSAPVGQVSAFVDWNYALARGHASVDDAGVTVTAAAGRATGMRPGPTVTLHPPPGSTADAVLEDPSGKRLAWVLRTRHTSRLAGWLHRLAAAIPLRSDRRVEVWTSRVDGTHMREVGYVFADAGGDEEQDPRFVQWMPDGRRLSFVYKGSLWSVPAAPER